MAKEIAEEYTSSLADLTLNSKPLINMLTMLADDNIEHAEAIVEAVENHLEKVRSDYKLPVLYLIDSIVKNVGRTYTTLFTQNIVNTFCNVFEKVDEKVRAQMFKLRQTWNDVFPPKKMYTLDVRVQYIDPAWPITAPPPTHSIHVNPRFFNNPTNASRILDPNTIDMQTQLINKQKELLELKQKKLELELLQAKAKLEEQQKQLERQSIQIKTPQQVVVKSEVSKPSAVQNSTGVPVTSAAHKSGSVGTVSTTAKGAATSTTSSGSGLRIAPVNSALIASVRPALRDPRLLRQQGAGAGVPPLVPSSQLGVVAPPTTNSTSHNYEHVNLDDKNKLKSKSHNAINVGCATGNDKTTHVNKNSAQPNNTLTRKDPRLLSNKVQGSSATGKGKTSSVRAASDRGAPPKLKAGSSLSRKSNKSSSSSAARSFKAKVDAPSSDGSASSACVKGVKDAPNNKSVSDSAIGQTKSTGTLSKYKKSPRSDKSSGAPAADAKGRAKAGKASRSRDRPADKYVDDTPTSTASAQSISNSTAPANERAFKDLKGSTKNRNYMRRNRAISISPEPSHDVDLRIGAPPEKQARLQPDLSDESAKNSSIEEAQVNKDVDLRTLVVPAPINKKRPSIEKLEHSTAKKSKSQMFDVLFGNEDVDLRQLPPVLPTTSTSNSVQSVARPPTPPPPIISTSPSDRNEIKSKEIKSNFDAIRAKLANATKISAISDDQRKTIPEDTDMRLKKTLFQEKTELFPHKIFISPADEQSIKNGNLSKELLEKVLATFETQKLQEAQRQESEEMKNIEFGNTTLTPISDDELSADFSHSDSDEEYKGNKKNEQASTFGDTDDRVPPPAPVIGQHSTAKDAHILPINSLVEQTTEPNASHGNTDTRTPGARGPPQNMEHGSTWHPHHRRRRPKSHWDSPPPPIPGPEPWLRPPPAVLNQPPIYQGRRKFPFIRPPVEAFGPRLDGPVPTIPQHIVEPTRTVSPPAIGSQNTKELPGADPLVLEYIEQDTMRTINIDGRPREIRYYDETAVVIMSWDDPREISFQDGTRVVTFDDESYTFSFNDEYREITIGGKPHKVRLGAPTRELYIDGKWHECFFGGPGLGIEIDGKMRIVKMDGPPPHVKIGTVKRTDLVAGKINLIINARTMVPVFLDAKPQKFDIEGKIHTLRFVDALRTVLINEIPFKVEFGGLPKPITVHDKKHFIRFSVLPRGIKPGYVNIANMEGQRFASPPRTDRETSNDATSVEPVNNISVTEPALPMLGKRRVLTTEQESPDSSRNSPTLQGSALQLGTLDVLSSIITSPMANSSNTSGYQIEKRDQDSQDGFPVTRVGDQLPVTSDANTTSAPLPFLPPNLNINELFQKLVASGIVTSVKEKTPPPQKQKDDADIIRPVLFTQPETLKIRQPPLIAALYSGMQCSSCGVRFPPEHSMQYSQHLDWHFRQNRRGRNSARKALCRKWYYDVSDWKNFEEIEDIEEREKNWFESQQQQQQAEGAGEDGEEEIEIPSVPAESNSPDTCCEVCHDKFEQFYNEEKEEWHLRMAIRIDNKTYHPLCYDDYKASLQETPVEETLPANLNLDNKTENTESQEKSDEKVEPKKEENEIVPEETEKEPIVKEIILTEASSSEKKEDNDDDDDVLIEEPKIEQIEIDDKPENDEQALYSDDSEKNENSSDLLSKIVIKQEPVDDDTELFSSGIKTEIIDPEIEDQGDNVMSCPISTDTTHAELVSSIDGNVQLNTGVPITVASNMAGKIKINITKPILAAPKEMSTLSETEASCEPSADGSQSQPNGDEHVQQKLKPALQGLTLTKQSPVMKGTELTGLCSIM